MTNSRLLRSLFVALAASLASTTGCAMQAGDLDMNEELETSAASLAGTFTQYTWSQGDPTLDLAPLDTHFCALTAVGGTFRGPGEEVRIYGNSSRNKWELHGKSNQTGVGAMATCYRRDAFTGFGGDKVKRLASTEYKVSVYNEDAWIGDSFPSIAVSPDTWQGDAVFMLTGLSGDLRGSGERVQVDQGPSGTAYNRMWATCDVDGDYVIGYAHNFFVGVPYGGRPARFVNHADHIGTYDVDDSSYIVTSDGETDRERLTTPDRGFCYLVGVHGSLSSAQEGVRIELRDGYWQLVAKALPGHTLSAVARCMGLDQTQA